MEAVLESVRGYLEELLKPVTPEQLYEAIQQNVDPWKHAPVKVRRKGSTWARNLRKYQNRITPKLVLSWLQADRPDLHNLIINMGPKGTKWLTRMTESIKEHIWPPEEKLKRVPKAPEKEEELLEQQEEPPEQPEEPTVKIKYI